MAFFGKLHEISLYGLAAAILCLVKKKITIALLWSAKFRVSGFWGFFYTYLFWASVLFIPIAIIGALVTKYVDDGEGLTFDSDNFFVIIFAHLAEEILGLVLTPIWFIKDLVTGDLEFIKVVDYVLWVVEIIYIGMNLLKIF